MQKNKQSFQLGFTLIELLIVIAIIGILASIVLVSLGSARERAKMAKFKAVAHSMQTKAIEACDTGALDYTDVTGSFGDIPDDAIDVAGIIEVTPSDCGSTSTAQTFQTSIPAANLTGTCVATIEETGVTGFAGTAPGCS